MSVSLFIVKIYFVSNKIQTMVNIGKTIIILILHRILWILQDTMVSNFCLRYSNAGESQT